MKHVKNKYNFFPNYDPPPGKIAEEKTGNLPILAIGGRGGYPLLVKDQYISVFSLEGFSKNYFGNIFGIKDQTFHEILNLAH